MKKITRITFTLMALGSSLAYTSSAQTISAGSGSSLSICNGNTAMSWGANTVGELGDSTHTNRTSPVQVKNLTGVVAISSGGSHTLALKGDGTVWSWGYNTYSSLGIGVPGGDRDTAVQVSTLSNIIAVSAGGYHSLALRNDGTVWSWGSNFGGEIGDGTISVRATPVQV